MSKGRSPFHFESGDFEESELNPDSEIPPAIACAVCGLTDCEGCQEPASTRAQELSRAIAWEQKELSHRERLWSSTRATALQAETTFRDLAREALDERSEHKRAPGTISSAFSYAFIAEFWAVLSWTLPWAIGFSAFMPRLAWHMLSTPSVLALGLAILLLLVLGVVLIHMWWGLTVEWGVARAGRRASYATGLRFGLYACGWDLLTSPAGLFVHVLRSGWKQGFESVRAGAQAPRAAMNAYLLAGRRLSESERRTAMWTAIAVTTAGLLAGFGSILVGIVWWILRDL